MTRATRATINLAACRHNLKVAQHHSAGAKQLCVIKANAYGHGMVPIAQALQDADAFAVATIEEAIFLREGGIHQPVVLLEGFTDQRDLLLIQAYHLMTVIHHESQLCMLEALQGEPVDVWLKIDTGMHRLGFLPENVPAIFQRLQQCSAVNKPFRLMSHLASADERHNDMTRQQISLFDETCRQLAAENYETSIANSAGILGWPESHRNWQRPGIMLYGVSPFEDATSTDLGLQPVMTLRSNLIAVNHYKKGQTIGYGGSYTCEQDMMVGVAAIGYGDGYPRHAGTGTPVLVNGQRVPLIGRVSMDMITVDLRNHPAASIGDEVVLWGEGLPVEEIAAHAGTIGYELLCGVTRRVEFIYK